MIISGTKNNLPERVQIWMSAARKVDQSAEDRDKNPDSLKWRGAVSVDGTREIVEGATGSFDAQGERDVKLTLSSTENFWRSRIKLETHRNGDHQDYTVCNQHPKDPEMFDYRAKFSKNLSTGAIEHLEVREGVASFPELVRQWSSEPSSLAVLGGTGVVMAAGAFALTGSFPGAALAGLFGTAMAGVFLAGNNAI